MEASPYLSGFFTLAVILHLPFLTGITRPLGLTFATPVSLDFQARSMAPKSVLELEVSSMTPLPELSR